MTYALVNPLVVLAVYWLSAVCEFRYRAGWWLFVCSSPFLLLASLVFYLPCVLVLARGRARARHGPRK